MAFCTLATMASKKSKEPTTNLKSSSTRTRFRPFSFFLYPLGTESSFPDQLVSNTKPKSICRDEGCPVKQAKMLGPGECHTANSVLFGIR